MIAVFSVLLEARDPERNRWRSYRVEAGRDLLGDWIVEVTFGRIGARGRTLTYAAADEDQARRLTAACLRRRVSAPRRIGVAYELIERTVEPNWASIAL